MQQDSTQQGMQQAPQAGSVWGCAQVHSLAQAPQHVLVSSRFSRCCGQAGSAGSSVQAGVGMPRAQAQQCLQQFTLYLACAASRSSAPMVRLNLPEWVSLPICCPRETK